MCEGQNGARKEGLKVKILRPVLIASERTVQEYSGILHNLLLGLADESINAAVVYPHGMDMEGVVSPTAEAISHPMAEFSLLGLQSKRILLEKLEKFKGSILHCLCESKSGLVKYLSEELGLPYVLQVNSLQEGLGRVSISSRQCVRIIVPTKSIAEDFLRTHPKFSGRIQQINAGTFVDENRKCFSKRDRIVSIVTVSPRDGIGEFDNLLGAVKHLAIEGYEFMLVIIGGGRSESRLRKLLSARGLSKLVVNVPQLEPRRGVLAAGDIFVHHQPSTIFDTYILEAMSVGTVVAGCKGGVDDLLIEGKTAAVFDPRDELSIKGCLQQLLDRRELSRKLATAAKEHLRKYYSVSKMVESVLGVYRTAQEWRNEAENV